MRHDQIDPGAPDPAFRLSGMLRDITRLGRGNVEVQGLLQSLDGARLAQDGALHALKRGSDRIGQASRSAAETSARGAGTADAAAERMQGAIEELTARAQIARGLAAWVCEVQSGREGVDTMLRAVQRSNADLTSIAAQVNILAMNAKIEAARAGDAGRGFAIVAEAINDLSHKTRTAAARVSTTVQQMSDWIGLLHDGAHEGAAGAETLLSTAESGDTVLREVGENVAALRTEAHRTRDAAAAGRAATEALLPAARSIAAFVTELGSGLDGAQSRMDDLIGASEAILQQIVHLGGSGEDTPLILLAQDCAGRIAEAFETCIETGQISLQALFDQRYEAIPDTQPQQVMAPFTAFTDAVLPAIQEPVLDHDPRIAFCAAVDRNGYLPTHNQRFSHPQSSDPVWNAAHCRNRRIFNDRVGLKAGQNTEPFLLQIYRRDMGGGDFRMMKDLSVPIFVQGQHWGGLRVAYAFDT